MDDGGETRGVAVFIHGDVVSDDRARPEQDHDGDLSESAQRWAHHATKAAKPSARIILLLARRCTGVELSARALSRHHARSQAVGLRVELFMIRE